MPGVPPDALANVKRGLKNIFSRKKKDKSRDMAASEGSGTAMGGASSQQTTSIMPQIAEPATTAESKNIDLNPITTVDDTSAGTATATTSGMADTVTNPRVDQSVMDPMKLDAKIPAEGMSATSGPLSDDLGAMAVSEEQGLGMAEGGGGEEMKNDMAATGGQGGMATTDEVMAMESKAEEGGMAPAAEIGMKTAETMAQA
ncbi:MAG: hypothetical protein MMC33_002739 [Icmadophila ericetorum]|nr:hypothetical protein [Icmadophila ericetorum]